MARVRRREQARRDPMAQWVWYAENGGIETADRFLAAVERTMAMLAKQPEAGSRLAVRQARLEGMRRFPVGGCFESILLFYLPVTGGIDLVRVVRGSRDLRVLFGEPLAG